MLDHLTENDLLWRTLRILEAKRILLDTAIEVLEDDLKGHPSSPPKSDDPPNTAGAP